MADVDATMAGDFLAAAEASAVLLDRPELARRWDEPSLLAGFGVAELAGHFVRAVGVTNAVLARGRATGAPIRDLARSYAAGIQSWADRSGVIHSNATAEATLGPDGLALRYRAALAECHSLLGAGRPSPVTTSSGDVLSLADYLLVRAVELVTHADDLAASLGQPPPQLPGRLTRAVTDLLVNVARARHGEMAVLRALARRERDEPEALRVI